jgi:Fanconi anemia group M protein
MTEQNIVINKNKPILIVDTREPKKLVEYLVVDKRYDDRIIVERKTLPVDYMILGNRGIAIIQRKTTTDLVRSITDGTIWHDFATLSDLKSDLELQHKTIAFLLLEGSLWKVQKYVKKQGFSANTIIGTIVSGFVDYEIPTMWITSPYYSALTLGSFALALGKVKERKEIGLRPKPRLETLEEKAQFLVEGLPEVSGTLAKRLLQHFGSPRKVFMARPEQLMQIEGIGKKKAEFITQVLDYEFSK